MNPLGPGVGSAEQTRIESSKEVVQVIQCGRAAKIGREEKAPLIRQIVATV